MLRILLSFTLMVSSLTAYAGEACRSTRSDELPKLLGFQLPIQGAIPGGWTSRLPDTVSMESATTPGDTPSVRIERAIEFGDYTSLLSCVLMDFAGKDLELRGRMRTEHVHGLAGLWLRQEASRDPVAFANMQDKKLEGTTEWTEYSVSLPRKPEGHSLSFGIYLSGTGKVWVSDLQLLVDGKPIWEAPAAEVPQTIFDTDTQFDQGSGITLQTLSGIQLDNLVTLGRVWGFLKYYHPAVRTGQRQWDYDLLRIMPAVLAAPDRTSGDEVLVGWIKSLGPVPACKPCGHLDTHALQRRPDLAWIGDEHTLGKTLSRDLRWIRDNNPGDSQFYLTMDPENFNPIFKNELRYESLQFPDPGFQLLALFRFWNMVQYWYPYRDVIGEDWGKVLEDSIPRLALAPDRAGYVREMMALIASVHDTHASLWSSLDARPPIGDCHLPVQLRFIRGEPVVTGPLDGDAGKTSGLQAADVITQLDGTPVSTLVKRWSPYYGASNQAALLRQIATTMTQGACGDTHIGVRRNGKDMELSTKRVMPADIDSDYVTHDLPGPTFRRLSPDVAYLKLSTAKAADAADYVKQAAGAKALIIDIRNYPSEFMVFALGSLLVQRETPFARFTGGDLSNPGAFHWTLPVSLTPAKPHFAGKIVILVDETSQSQSEYTSLAFRSVPGAIVVGSTTAGADGDISEIRLPGGLSTVFSGIGVFYPDKRPTQRVGIVPDVVVIPTLAGIRAGRDAVLEKALRLILGPKVPDAEIQKLYAGS
ncbi:MAG TPA: S41 family peptidase [Gammaproteobacteria bacterium]|jgi:hypothetical protein